VIALVGSAEGRPDIRHRDEDTVRVVGITQRPETKIGIELPSALEMLVLEHVENDGRCAHLIGDAEAAFHGIHQEGGAKAFALHVGSHRDGTHVDHRDVWHSGALPLVRFEIGSDCHGPQSVEPQNGGIILGGGNPCVTLSALIWPESEDFRKLSIGPKPQEKALRSCSAWSNLAMVSAGVSAVVSVGILEEAFRRFDRARQTRNHLSGCFDGGLECLKGFGGQDGKCHALLHLLRSQKGSLTDKVGFLQTSGSRSGLDPLFIGAMQAQFLALPFCPLWVWLLEWQT